MTRTELDVLDPADFGDTRDALHAYARVLGSWTSGLRQRRKHWWHGSLRPSLYGLTTGVVHAGSDFDVELDFQRSLMRARTASGHRLDIELAGQTAAQCAAQLREFLMGNGLPEAQVNGIETPANAAATFPDYSPEQARRMLRTLRFVSGALASFRAGLREETSPIQLWPHHFDLSMVWLSGKTIDGQDPDDEESADEQMNFGFAFGDDGVPEPYFYITAYPLPQKWRQQALADGATWHESSFTGVLLTYAALREAADPHAALLGMWQSALASRQLLCSANGG